MRARFTNKRISGILTVFPEYEHSFEETIETDSLTRVRRLKRIMGFGKRRRVKYETNATDIYLYGLRYLVENELIRTEEIGAIVTVSLSPDYFLPTMANVIHGELGLSAEVVCVDIAQGCAGYLVGLQESFVLLEHLENKKVVLLTGDILNREPMRKEDGTMPEEAKTQEPSFGGDAATISVIENTCEGNEIFYNYYTNGRDGLSLIMPAGAFAHPVYDPQDVWVTMGDGSVVNGLGIIMNGSDVFNFIMKEVPPCLEDLFSFSGVDKTEVHRFFFHQPNRYILEKLADRAGIPRERLPMDIVEKYGNSNSSTIPVTITEHLTQQMKETKQKCCLSGFGSGLTWASMLIDIGEMDFCEKIISNC